MIRFESIRQVVVSVVLAAYILAVVTVGAFPSPLTSAWSYWFKPALNYVGLYNSYGMFAPDPIKYNQEFRALIRYKDGSLSTWKFPSLPDWKNDDVTRQRKLPWVEWQCYFAFDPANDIIVEDAARYVAWLHRNPHNPPVQVEIVRDCCDIVVESKEAAPAKVASGTILKYDVSEEDLK